MRSNIAVQQISSDFNQFSHDERQTLLLSVLGGRDKRSDLLEDFIKSNPSFASRHTVQTYLTEVSRYLMDWLFRFAELPVRFAPMIKAAEIMDRYCQAERELSASEKTPLWRQQMEKKLHNEWSKFLDQTASVIKNTDVRSKVVKSRVRGGKKEVFLPRTGIARDDQFMLEYLLAKFKSNLDADFWHSALSNKSIGELMDYYREEGNSSASICLRMTAINHFRNFISKEFQVHFNDEKLKQPRRGERIETVLEVSELELIANKLNKNSKRTGSYKALRNEVLFGLSYATGIRASEILSLKVEDINFKKGTIKYIAKNNKERELPLFPEMLIKLRSFLKLHVKFLKSKGLGVSTSRHLFYSTRGKVLSRFRLYDVYDSIARDCGFEQKVGPHTIRRSMACALYDKGAPVHAIQQLLGHKSPKTTLLYLSHGSKEVAELLFKFHPLSPDKSGSVRSESCRQYTLLHLETKTREQRSLFDFKVRTKSDFLHASPGYLEDFGKSDIDSSNFINRFTSVADGSSLNTKKQYQSAVRHFIIGRFHELELPQKYAALLATVIQVYLIDRLDWLVRTEEISKEAADKLYRKCLRLKADSPQSLIANLVSNDSASSVLLSGVKINKRNNLNSLWLQPILQLDKNNKTRGQREKMMTDIIFSRTQEFMDEAFWRLVFNPEKAGRVFEQEMSHGVLRSTIEKQKAALRMFGKFLYNSCQIAAEKGNSVVDVESSRISSERPQKFLTEHEMTAMISTLNEECRAFEGKLKLRSLRDRAVLLLLYSTAVRGDALCGLKLGDIDFKRETAYFREKGGREVLLPLMPDALKALNEYLKFDGRGKQFHDPTYENDTLFYSMRDKALDIKTVQRLLNRTARESKIRIRMRGNSNISAHVIRRSTAIHMANNGASLFDLQKLLGHKDLSTTSLYVSHGTVELRGLLHDYLPVLN